jgi:hypothetical protein
VERKIKWDFNIGGGVLGLVGLGWIEEGKEWLGKEEGFGDILEGFRGWFI